MSSVQKSGTVFLEQKIPSRMDEADLLCLKVRETLEANGLSRLSFPVELLTRECLENALKHGNGNDPAKAILLQLRAGRTWIRLQVTDEGPGFAWRKALQTWVSTTEPCGRGMSIYTLYAERFRFNRCGNRITFWIDKKKQAGNGD
jgi:anti-sigma regulatory factor (Ser/Thr protein kinase)